MPAMRPVPVQAAAHAAAHGPAARFDQGARQCRAQVVEIRVEASHPLRLVSGALDVRLRRLGEGGEVLEAITNVLKIL